MTESSLGARLRATFDRLRSEGATERVESLHALMKDHHERACRAASGKATARSEPILAMARHVLGDAEEDVTELLKDGAIVQPDGSLLGTGRYEQADPRWSLALIEYLKYEHDKVAFGDTPRVIDIGNEVDLAIVGDWGTGYWRGADTPASKVARRVEALAPGYTIHLGDVYYAGTDEEEQENLVATWPRGATDQFALNSNHEMYTGGRGYFSHALPQLFSSQAGTSYFALRNDHWLILGLDTAYEATDLYLQGNLGDDTPQIRWLQTLSSEVGDRRVMILSHHEARSMTGDAQTLVGAQLEQHLRRTPDYWYWGHLHDAIVYRPTPSGMRGRCVGHGAIPYGKATALEDAPDVAWYETRKAGDPECVDRVLCGFAHVVLDGEKLTERLISEDGDVRWSG